MADDTDIPTVEEGLRDIWDSADAEDGNEYASDDVLLDDDIPLGEIAAHMKARGVTYKEFHRHIRLRLEAADVPSGN